MSEPVAAIRALLGGRGVVSVPPAGPVVVYLHANHGRYWQETVVQDLAALDGVEGVQVSEHAWTILLVQLTAG